MIPKTAFIIIIAVISIAFLSIPVSAVTWTQVNDSWVTTDGTYNITMWNSTGAHNWSVPAYVYNVTYLVIAGGGGAGGNPGAGMGSGGGGAGGLLTATINVTAGNTIPLYVGLGGVSNASPTNGGNSTFNTSIIALGGGAGGNQTSNAGKAGGSSGGSTNNGGNTASLNSSQGNAGGNGDSSQQTSGGGGGGYVTAGANAGVRVGGNGGNGTQLNFTGENVYYACGGGGSSYQNGDTNGKGGSNNACGGAGNNSTGLGTPGIDGTGGGGGGAFGNYGGKGGNGTVIIKFITGSSLVNASFTINPNYNSTYPVPVQFTDTSAGYPSSWSWNFNDTYTNTTANPNHVYTVAGIYNISLNVTNSSSSIAYGTFNLSSDSDSFLKSWMHLNTSVEDLQGLAWQNHSAIFVTSPTKFGGGALQINDKTRYIWTPSSTNLNLGNNSGEIEFWINTTTAGAARNIISHTSADGSGTTGGWGFYQDGSGNYGFWLGALANETSTFTMTTGTWHHVAVAIPASGGGNINIYRDGVIVANGTRPTGNFTTVQPLVIGGGAGGGAQPNYYIDEFRYSIGTPRFTMSTFSPPYSQYRGNLNLSYPNINENATLLYKSYPSDTAAIVYNGSPRYRTPQVMNMTNATSLQFAVGYNPAFERALTPVVNHTNYADINFTLITQDTVNGIERVNVFRDSGLGFNASPAGTRTNLVDLPIDYYNYTTEPNFTMSWENATITDGQHNVTYPITKFLYTVVTYGQWTIYTNFTASSTTFPLGNSVTFTDTSLGEPANWTQWNWSFGNGNYSTAQNPTYTYPAAGTYTINFTSTLIANSSVTNTTTRVGYIQVTTAPGSVTNLTGNYINCTAVRYNWTNPTNPDFNGILNWFNNVQQTNLTNTSTGISFSGLVQNSSYTFSTKTFNNATPPQINANYINVTTVTPWCSPIANWTAAPTTGNYTFQVQFTDGSYNDPAVAWEWSFGDNTTNSTLQNPMHGYTYAGTFSPTLTVQNSSGFKNSLQRVGYIISNQGLPVNATPVTIRNQPVLVQFNVKTFWGQIIPNATVRIQGITSTTTQNAWLQTLLFIPLDQAPIENTLLFGATDNYGAAEFMMIPTMQYNVTVTAPGYSFPALTIYPHDREYTIVASPLPGEGWTNPTVVNKSGVVTNVTAYYVSDTNQGINVSYSDATGISLGGYVNITGANGTVIQSHYITTNSFTMTQPITVPLGGTSVKVSVRAYNTTHTTYYGGNVSQDYGVSFSGPPVAIVGLDPELMMWGSFALIMITGLAATSTASPMVAVIVIFEAWMFLAIGWLKPLTDRVGIGKVSALFLLATVIVILWNFRIAKLKELGR